MNYKLILNGKEINQPTASTIKELVSILDKDFISKNEIILQILIDGNPYLFVEQEESLFLDSVKSIEVTTANSKDITLAGVMDSLTHLNILINQLQEVVEKIQSGNEKEGLDFLLTTIEGLRWFNAVLLSVEGVLGFDLREMFYNGESFENHRNKLNKVLNEMLAIFKMKDWVGLADTIEYELVPHLEEWKSWMPTLMKLVQKNIQ